MVDGGLHSFIGETHRVAARLDGLYDICASALSANPERSHQEGLQLGISPQRAYRCWQELIAGESQRSDKIDVLAVVTPNDSPHAICMAALRAGIHILCEKPITNDSASDQALAQQSAYRASGLVYARDGVLLAGCKSLPELATAP